MAFAKRKEKAIRAAILEDDLEHSESDDIRYWSTGFRDIDEELLVHGGLAGHRIHELVGKSGAGKSLMLYNTIAGVCEDMAAAEARGEDIGKKRRIGLIDTEGNSARDEAFKDWLELNGVDLGRLTFFATGRAERVWEKAIEWVESDEYALVAIDSIANVDTEVNMDRAARFDAPDQVGALAKLTTRAAIRLCEGCRKTHTMLVGVNQVRVNIDAAAFGSKESYPGGENWKHNRATSLRLIRIGDVKSAATGKVRALKVKVELLRSKYGATVTGAEAPVLTIYLGGRLVNRVYQTLDQANRMGVVAVSGTWHSFGELKAQGVDGLAKIVRKDVKDGGSLLAEIESATREAERKARAR